MGAVVLGVGDDEIDRAAAVDVAQVVQGACGDGVAAGAVTTAAASRREVAAAPLNTGLGKVLDASDTFGAVGDVLAWPGHGSSSFRNRPPIFILRFPRAPLPHPRC